MSLCALRLSSRPSTSILLGLALVTLTACGGQSTATPQAQTQTHAVGAPQSLSPDQQAATGPFAEVTPLELKPGGSLGSLGLNLQPLFAEDLKSPSARLDRLEATVLAIQSDLQTLAPSMQRMAVVENDLAAAVQELREILVQQNAQIAAAPAAKAEPKKATAPKPTPVAADKAAPAPAPVVTGSQTDATGAILPATPVAKAPETAPVAETTTTAPSTTENAIQALRLGEHPGKTRVVFDVTQKPTFRTDLDNNEKLLIIEIDNATWNGKIPAALSSTLVQSYSTQALDNNAGTRIIMMLKKPVKISQASILGPDSARGPHRLVLDLNAL